MNIVNKYGTVNTTYKGNRQIKYIVVHYTAGVTSKSGTAVNTATWYKSGNARASSDYVVDDTIIAKYNGDIRNRYTWHCGGSFYKNKGGKFYGKCTNANSIGIEVCCMNDTGRMTNSNDGHFYFTDLAVKNTIELVKELMKEYNIPIGNVIRHYDVTGKLCPGIIGWNEDSGDNSKWIDFKNKLSTVTITSSTATTNKSEFKPYLIQVISKDGFINIRKTPTWSDNDIVGRLPKSNIKYTIVAETVLDGTKFGKLKSGVGWISLNENYVKKL